MPQVNIYLTVVESDADGSGHSGIALNPLTCDPCFESQLSEGPITAAPFRVRKDQQSTPSLSLSLSTDKNPGLMKPSERPYGASTTEKISFSAPFFPERETKVKNHDNFT
jgi:hypothetical protein